MFRMKQQQDVVLSFYCAAYLFTEGQSPLLMRDTVEYHETLTQYHKVCDLRFYLYKFQIRYLTILLNSIHIF